MTLTPLAQTMEAKVMGFLQFRTYNLVQFRTLESAKLYKCKTIRMHAWLA